ncbi:MAG: hypothetical protein QOJ90_2100 [Actinomycetota bacterium]|nr:hypothetical protein [Actinomycetota bacterium]
MLLTDLALGGATGLALELAAWAIFTSLHAQAFLWIWPLLVVIPFVAVPALRRHWNDRPAVTERSRLTSWLVAGAFLYFTLGLAVGSMRTTGLPPHANLYYEDIYWHLSIAEELTRQVPPEVPQMAGHTLHYHWFSNAHMAASHLVSGVNLPVIMLRLWLLPVVAIILGLVVAVARKATGLAWTGAVACIIVVAPALLMPWRWFHPYNSAALVEGSPSQVFGLVFLLLACHVLLDLVRGRSVRWGWVVLFLAAAAAPGSKPSVLPVLLGGLGVVVVFDLFRRQPIRAPIGAILLIGASVLISSPLTAQSAAGSSLKVFGLLTFEKPWNAFIKVHKLPGTGDGRFIYDAHKPGALALALILVAALLLQYAWVLAGLTLVGRRTRRDPAVWLLSGCVVAGLAAMLVVDHPGASEVYFAKTVTPLAAILAAWGLAAAFPAITTGPSRVRLALGLAAGVAVGAICAVLSSKSAPRPTGPSDYPHALLAPFAIMLVVAVVVAVAGAAGFLLRRRLPDGSLRIFGAAAIAALLAVFLVQTPFHTAQSVRAATRGTSAAPKPWGVTAQEAAATAWLARHASSDDVVATNVHCKFKVTRRNCDARAFWVSALGAHRVLIEGWAYTEEALQRQGLNGRGFVTQPFYDPKLFAANEGAFTDPTPAGLAELRDKHGVRWLFADRAAGPVSPRLEQVARLRFSNADVKIFELPGPSAATT